MRKCSAKVMSISKGLCPLLRGNFLRQLERAVEEALLLTPATAVQQAIFQELQAEWPALRDLLSTPDEDLRLEALEILLDLLKGIRGNWRRS